MNGGDGKSTVGKNLNPTNQESVAISINQGSNSKGKEVGGNLGVLNKKDMIKLTNRLETENKGITVIENKKRRTFVGRVNTSRWT